MSLSMCERNKYKIQNTSAKIQTLQKFIASTINIITIKIVLYEFSCFENA